MQEWLESGLHSGTFPATRRIWFRNLLNAPGKYFTSGWTRRLAIRAQNLRDKRGDTHLSFDTGKRLDVEPYHLSAAIYFTACSACHAQPLPQADQPVRSRLRDGERREDVPSRGTLLLPAPLKHLTPHYLRYYYTARSHATDDIDPNRRLVQRVNADIVNKVVNRSRNAGFINAADGVLAAELADPQLYKNLTDAAAVIGVVGKAANSVKHP